MAATIAGAQILIQSGRAVIDRLQSAGPGDLSISRDKIKEIGNENSIGTTTGKPEVSFNLESFDTSVEFECKLVNKDYATFPTTPGSNEIDFKDAIPIDIVSLFKAAKKSDNITNGVITPYLTLNSVSYRFGVGDNAQQTFGLTGDTQLLVPGQPYEEEFTNIGVGPYTLKREADLYKEGVNNIYVLSVALINSADNLYERVYFDPDGEAGYTNTPTGFTLPEDRSADYDKIRVTYSSQEKEAYVSSGTGPDGQVVHEGISVKPAAVRAEHLDVYIGSAGATPVFTRMNSVQNIEATWSVSLENGEELGNKHYTYSEYDVPDVTGSIGIKPISNSDLAKKLSQITGVPEDQVIGVHNSVPVPVEMRIHHPDTGLVLKTIYIPDARFDIPGWTVQPDSRLENTLNFTSDSGEMLVYNGKRT